MASSTTVAAVASPSSANRTFQPETSQTLNILDLPPETQHGIFSHCAPAELVTLSVVSKRFHELAAAQLYRSFHIILPSHDNPRSLEPLSTLTGGLDTLTTSDFDYARYLKHFFVDTQSIGDKAKLSYQAFQFSNNCGRFLNTLLHLALRDARSLESFKWNIRVELSRPVFRALHQLPSLNELYIRMHAGPSLYEPPRPLPLGNPTSSYQIEPPPPPPPPHPMNPGIPGGWAMANMPPPPPPNQGLFGGLSFVQSQYVTPPSHFLPVLPPPPKPPVSKPKNHRRLSVSEDPPTLSAFKNLKRLSILDIDSLDMIPEIKACIQNSESTLRHLSLSFSTGLAKEARETNPDPDPDATDLDDDFQIPEQASSFDGTGPSRSPMAQKEWKVQEAVLAQIFGVDRPRSPRRQSVSGGESGDEGESDESDEIKDGTPAEEFIASLKSASESFLTRVGGANMVATHHQEVINVIGGAVKAYINVLKQGSEEVHAGNTGDAAEGDAGPDAATVSQTKTTDDSQNNWGLDDIDIAHPGGEDSLDSGDDGSASAVSGDEGETWSTKSLRKKKSLSSTPSSSSSRRSNSRASGLATRTRHPRLEAECTGKAEESKRDQISAYVKSTRGLGLSSLSIQLMPVKPSALSHALDLHVLRSLTLLNVGNQTPLWSLLARENQVQPLALRNIFTDNVSSAFVKCVAQLDEVHELLLLERSPKYRPATFLPRSNVLIRSIRQEVLRKHVRTLRCLMIRNDTSSAWDLDAKTIIMLCTQGAHLEELSGGFRMVGVHTLLQHFSGLRKLRALHISPFRSDDTCAWAIQETTKFFVDSLVHHPQHELEWLAVGERVTGIIRDASSRSRRKSGSSDEKDTSTDSKGKGKAVLMTPDEPLAELGEASGSSAAGQDWDSEASSSEDDMGDSEDEMGDSALKLKSRSFFLDYVGGVRVFEKEVRAGEL